MTDREKKEIIELVHKTLRGFFEPFPEGELEGRPFTQTEKVLLKVNKVLCEKIKEIPTVEAYTFEQVQDLVTLNKKLSEQIRLHGEWKNGKCTNCGAECFEDDYMRDIETEFCHRCGADMRKEGEAE